MMTKFASKKSVFDRVYSLITILSVCFLCFVAGGAIYEFKIFPYDSLNRAFSGFRAIFGRYIQIHQITRDKSRTSLWRPVREKHSGVVSYQREKAFPGLTLFTSGHRQAAFLINLSGEIVHQWQLPFHQVWSDPPHVFRPVPANLIYYRKTQVMPNGDLLAIFEASGDTPYGYGLIKMDKDSVLQWQYAERTHHDFDVGEDDRIYTLIHRLRKTPMPGAASVQAPFIDDYIVILSPRGKEMKRIHILQALVNSPYGKVLEFNHDTADDPLHTNAVKVVSETIAATHPYTKAGQILISLRSLNTIAIIDPELERVVWAIRGSWHAQHDPDFLPDGRLLLFDNLGHIGNGGRSRILEIDPLSQNTLWQYTGDGKKSFDSEVRSAQQRLPNGNTLITESDGGRIVEVTRQKEIVWEYLNPHRGGDNDQYIAILSAAQRIAYTDLPFLDK